MAFELTYEGELCCRGFVVAFGGAGRSRRSVQFLHRGMSGLCTENSSREHLLNDVPIDDDIHAGLGLEKLVHGDEFLRP